MPIIVTKLNNKMKMQADIVSRQQRFLETPDRKEREKNIVVLGVPDGKEALDSAVTDIDELEKVWRRWVRRA